jgi:hypothetical protein
LIEAAKGGHTGIVQLLLEYPKSILNCAIHPLDCQTVSHETNRVEDESISNIDQMADDNATVTMPNPFPLPSPPLTTNPSFTLLERLEKIVPRNILEALKSVNTDGTDTHGETNNGAGKHRTQDRTVRVEYFLLRYSSLKYILANNGSSSVSPRA